MGTSYNPKIITNGLILNLDAGNKKSYMGSGSTVIDLTKNKLNATLANSPSYSGIYNGTLIYNGTNQYGTMAADSALLMGTNQFTAEVWCMMTASIPTQWKVLGTVGSSYGAMTMRVEPSYLVCDRYWYTRYAVSVPTFQQNAWYQLVITRDSSNNLIGYINGKLMGTMANIGGTSFGGYTNCIANNTSEGAGGYFTGHIPIIRIYNGKCLTVTEIYQNYNATKGRFGL